VRPDLLIGDLFAAAARAVPHRTAVALGARTMDFAELEAVSNRLARRLAALGIGRGVRVASWSGTAIESVPLFAALAKLGAPFIPVNGLLGRKEAQLVVDRIRPDLMVVDDAHGPAARELSVPVVVLDSLLDDSQAYDSDLLTEIPRPVGSDPHVVFFTSGSTGQPKGAVLSHEVNYLRTYAGALLEPRGAMVCPYPLFHMGAWTIALQQWQARDAVVLLESAEASAICGAVRRHRATRLNCIPAVWWRVLAELETASGEEALRSIRFADTGTSATPLELLEAMDRALPDAHVRVFYGSTEAGSVTSLDHADIRRKPGSCGLPGPGVRIRVDEDGGLWVTSTMLFDGYLDDERATEEVLVDGWYRTGDLGEVDDEGFLTIAGRANDVIRTGGESVAPAEVEAVLSELPSVDDVAVVGIPDPTWGEIVCAVLVAADGATPPTTADLRAHCQGRLASYKHPRRVEAVTSIPRTAATSQVQRRLLVERLSPT
jgi:acyl-CoA synthetase (AMP-forming)/AMP-acid ligase II